MPTKTRAPKKTRRAPASRSRSSSRTTKSSRSSTGAKRSGMSRRSTSRRSRSSVRASAPHRNLHTSQMTTDHDTIRQWAEERGGHPAAVKRTNRGRDTGIIRIDFPGFSGKGSLEEISWDDFFEKFDDSKLALVYQETTAGGEKSNFNKLVKRRGRK